MPNYAVVVLSHVLIEYFYFLVAANHSFAALENNLLYMCKSIMLPSLPVSTLYSTIIELWFDDVYRFVVITNC